MSRLKPLLRPLAAVASGLGMAALFPPYSVGALVWVVLVPLLVALWTLGERRRKRKAIGLGLLTGISYFLPNVAWLREVTELGWLAASLYLAVFPALWAWFAATWGNPWRDAGKEEGQFHVPRHALACALVWTGTEWLRSWLFTGFGWSTLGTAFHQTPVFAQGADLLGAVGLSILPVFMQASLIQICVRRVSNFHSGALQRRIALGSVVLAMVGAYGYGVIRLIQFRQPESIRLNALLVQLNIPQEASQMLWSATETHLGYEEETEKALDEIERSRVFRLNHDDGMAPRILPTPDWVVWPETSLTGRIMTADDGTRAMWEENRITIDRVRARGDFTMIMGLTEMEAERDGDMLVMKSEPRIWNSLAILPSEGELRTFRKHHLVIFGEYIPLVEKLPFLAKIYEQQAGVKYGGAFSVGESLEPLTVEIRGEQVGVIPTVCFEDTVPRLLRKFVRTGPQIIVNVTNDGWFKKSPGAAQHFATSRFRAIELRRPMLRCANTGVSAAITAAGLTVHPEGGRLQELRDETGSHFTRGHLLAEIDIPKDPPNTLYARIGDWGVIVLALVGLAMVARRK